MFHFQAVPENERQQNCFPLSKGKVLFREGQRANFAFVLRAGKVRLTMRPDKRCGARVLNPFAVMGLSACLAGGRYEATAEVLEDAEIAVAPRHELIRLLRNSPEAAWKAIQVLSEDVHRAYERVRQFSQ